MEFQDMQHVFAAELGVATTRPDIDIGLLADFCGVGQKTVEKWIAGTNLPRGDAFLKAWFLLGIYNPQSHVHMLHRQSSETIRYLFELYCYGVITITNVKEVIGVVNEQDAYRALRGSSQAVAKHDLATLKELYESDLDKCKTELGQIVATVVEQTDHLPPSVHDHTSWDIAEVTAHLMRALKPLAEALNSDEYTPEDRSRLRELAGDYVVFDLSNILNDLCSEMARKESK